MAWRATQGDLEIGRAMRDTRLGPIGGGTDEVMKEILAKQLGSRARAARGALGLVRPAAVLVEEVARVRLAVALLVALHSHPVEHVQEQHRAGCAEEERTRRPRPPRRPWP